MIYVRDICRICRVVKSPTLGDFHNGGELGVGMGSNGPVAEGKRAFSELTSLDDTAQAQKLSTAGFMAGFKGC
jgi:hypothetical protein